MLAVVPPTGTYTKAEQAHLFERECVCLVSGGRHYVGMCISRTPFAVKGPHTFWQERMSCGNRSI
jgi:hypothetical protein